MEPSARDALNRAARLSRLELAAGLQPEGARRGRELRAIFAAALALLLMLYPGMSAAAELFIKASSSIL